MQRNQSRVSVKSWLLETPVESSPPITLLLIKAVLLANLFLFTLLLDSFSTVFLYHFLTFLFVFRKPFHTLYSCDLSKKNNT